jgi:hypothetical protein
MCKQEQLQKDRRLTGYQASVRDLLVTEPGKRDSGTIYRLIRYVDDWEFYAGISTKKDEPAFKYNRHLPEAWYLLGTSDSHKSPPKTLEDCRTYGWDLEEIPGLLPTYLGSDTP